MSARTTPPFRADHVGSFLRPQALLEARDQFKAGKLEFALKDVDAPANHPKVLWIWRGNLIGTSKIGRAHV